MIQEELTKLADAAGDEDGEEDSEENETQPGAPEVKAWMRISCDCFGNRRNVIAM